MEPAFESLNNLNNTINSVLIKDFEKVNTRLTKLEQSVYGKAGP